MKILVFILLFFGSGLVIGQSQVVDTIKLKTADIFYSTGAGGNSFSLKNDSISTETLGDLLSNKSDLFVNKNGASGLQTISIRGAGSSHTQVFWNGLSLNSPTLGQLDFSTITTGTTNGIEIHYGAAGLIDGSGGLGGNIQLTDRLEYDSIFQMKLHLGYGSYLKNHQTIKAIWSNQKWSTFLTATKNNAPNKFEFIDSTTPHKTLDTLENAKVDLWSIKTGIGYKRKNSKIEAKIWYTDSKRQLPNNITASNFGNTHQLDQSLRSILNYNFYTNSTLHDFNIGFIDEQQEYHSDFISKIKTKSIQGNYRFTWYNNTEWKIKSAFEFIRITAISDGFPTAKAENKIAFMLNPQWKFKERLTTELILRLESYDAKIAPPMPAVLVHYHITKNIKWKGSAALVYKHPSLNDLYWTPGGNPNLLPEQGRSIETGVDLKITNAIKLNFTAFNRKIKDWIIWLPTDSVYSPENLFLVKSKGIDFRIELKKKISKKTLLLANINYSYTESKNTKSILENDNSTNKQLIFIPKSKVISSLSLLINKKIQFSYSYRFISKRYIARDHSQWMPYYMISDFSANYAFHSNTIINKINININNLLNKDYQVYPYQPMLKRNIMLSVLFNFEKK